MTQHIVSIGGGLSSTLYLPQVVRGLHPGAHIRYIMARLPNEDPDVWRLCDAVQADLGITIEYIGLGVSPWDIFWQEGMMGNSWADPCSRRLKREVLRDWLTANCDPATTMLHVGITKDEIERMFKIELNWRKQGWNVRAPLSEAEFLTRTQQMDDCRARYGFVPRLYEMGFTHNNCGGACIKAGHAEWARLLWYLPDVYAWWETNETAFRAVHGDVAILRDRTGGTTKPLPLAVLRARLQRHWARMLPGFDPFEGLESTPACAFCEAA